MMLYLQCLKVVYRDNPLEKVVYVDKVVEKVSKKICVCGNMCLSYPSTFSVY